MCALKRFREIHAGDATDCTKRERELKSVKVTSVS